MRRWLPYPHWSVFLFLVWLMLNQSVALKHVLLGAILAFGGSWLLAALQPAHGRIRRPKAIIKLVFLVLADVVRSNIAVGKIVLFRNLETQTSGFVCIPLALRDPYGLMVLACIITSTPGTLWVNFDSTRGVLMIHVLDLIDEDAWIEMIQNRYERLLREIFE